MIVIIHEQQKDRFDGCISVGLFVCVVVRVSAGELALLVMEGAMEGTRPRGAPRKQWPDNIRE